MSIDAIGDFLTVIRNALRVSHKAVSVPHSTIKEKIALILKQEGFIKDFTVTNQDNKPLLSISLKYFKGESAIHQLTRISTPGCRVYKSADNLGYVAGKFGISIISTNRGIMTNKQAAQQNVGGEIICSIW